MRNSSKRHFRSHVIVWFLLVAGFILSITGFSIYRSAESYLFGQFKIQQAQLSESIASLIDGKHHKTFTSKDSMKTQSYTSITQGLVRSMNSIGDDSYIYTLNLNKGLDYVNYAIAPDIRKDKSSNWYVTGQAFDESDEVKLSLLEFYKSTKPATTIQVRSKSSGLKYLGLAVIYDRQQNPSGLLVVESAYKSILALKEDLLESMLVTISFLFVSLLLASILFARKITGPFEQLTDAIERLIKNDFGFNLSLSGFAGFTYLAKQFNLMLLKLQVSRNDLISTNKAFSRFVPHQILKQISPNGIKGISLGDCIEKEMTILFCDIRGFTRLSESMPPRENFKFINRYLRIMVPVINKYGGSIDKYMGDGIMALFPGSADDALNAAVGMMQSLNEYNNKLKAKNLPNLEIGLGLHSGRMMLGTVGTNSRMDVTVISDTVNAAARIESLTKTFNTSILISEELRIRLENFDKNNLRFIATCYVQGKSKQMTIYEVFSQDPISLRKEKLENQLKMIDAWDLYKQGDVDQSVAVYQQLMEKSPMDKAQLALIEVVQNGRL